MNNSQKYARCAHGSSNTPLGLTREDGSTVYWRMTNRVKSHPAWDARCGSQTCMPSQLNGRTSYKKEFSLKELTTCGFVGRESEKKYADDSLQTET